jgi:hypothetical protein
MRTPSSMTKSETEYDSVDVLKLKVNLITYLVLGKQSHQQKHDGSTLASCART